MRGRAKATERVALALAKRKRPPTGRQVAGLARRYGVHPATVYRLMAQAAS